MKLTKSLLVAACAATFSLPTFSADAATLDLSTFVKNGSATASANELVLTKDEVGQAGSAYASKMISTAENFSISFDFAASSALSNGPDILADGFTFIFQSAGANALGGNGGYLGAEGIAPSAGVAFRSYLSNDAGIFLDGDIASGSRSTTPFSFTDFNKGAVSVSYNAATNLLSYSAFNSATSSAASGSANVDMATLLGSNAYFGFTGATGSATARQTISNVTITTAGAVPEPATWAMMMLGFGAMGFAMRRKKVSARIRLA